MKTYFVEMTDTFAGEANYAWVNRFKVTARSAAGAIRKVSNETGYRFRKQSDFGDCLVHDAVGACVRAFTHEWDQYCDEYSVREL